MMNIEGVDPSAHSTSETKLKTFIEEHINNSVPIATFFEAGLKIIYLMHKLQSQTLKSSGKIEKIDPGVE